MLQNRDRFFRLNKQYMATYDAIVSYRSLKDGRLEVSLLDQELCYVSKNKAATLKQWLNSFNRTSL